MNEQEALARMKAPGEVRPGKSSKCVIQLLVTSSCNLACFSCTQASQFRRPHWVMTPQQFETACQSLEGYQHIIGIFGGNPTLSKYFPEYCEILRRYFPKGQCGLWCNNLMGHGEICRKTFDPRRSNLNVHLDAKAYKEFKETWPESRPFGLHDDSRHAPVFSSMHKLDVPEEERWELISRCTINQFWSAMIGVFRGELRAWFCEIAGSQSILKQHDPDYPDTGHEVLPGWWRRPIQDFADQVRFHCHRCAVPLNGYGELSQSSEPEAVEQISLDYADACKPKRKDRVVQIVDNRSMLQEGRIEKVVDYKGNAKR